MKDSAREVNEASIMRLLVCIAAFTLAIGMVTASGQARGVEHAGMDSRFGPDVRFVPHRAHSPFCMTGAAASPFAFGIGPFSPFLGAGVFSPWYGGSDYPFSYYDLAASYENFQGQVAEYLENLDEEVQQLREDAERSLYSSPPQPPAEPKVINVSFAEKAPKERMPAAIFVLKNGKRIETTRYTLTADTLWVQRISEPRQKIPAGELNIEATTDANQQRGLSFKFPTSRSEILVGF